MFRRVRALASSLRQSLARNAAPRGQDYQAAWQAAYRTAYDAELVIRAEEKRLAALIESTQAEGAASLIEAQNHIASYRENILNPAADTLFDPAVRTSTEDLITLRQRLIEHSPIGLPAETAG